MLLMLLLLLPRLIFLSSHSFPFSACLKCCFFCCSSLAMIVVKFLFDYFTTWIKFFFNYLSHKHRATAAQISSTAKKNHYAEGKWTWGTFISSNTQKIPRKFKIQIFLSNFMAFTLTSSNLFISFIFMYLLVNSPLLSLWLSVFVWYHWSKKLEYDLQSHHRQRPIWMSQRKHSRIKEKRKKLIALWRWCCSACAIKPVETCSEPFIYRCRQHLW